MFLNEIPGLHDLYLILITRALPPILAPLFLRYRQCYSAKIGNKHGRQINFDT
jgi:hypothetical protein